LAWFADNQEAWAYLLEWNEKNREPPQQFQY